MPIGGGGVHTIAFLQSGRSDRQELGKTRVRFRPKADVDNLSNEGRQCSDLLGGVNPRDLGFNKLDEVRTVHVAASLLPPVAAPSVAKPKPDNSPQLEPIVFGKRPILPFQPVDATLCRKTNVSQKCF